MDIGTRGSKWGGPRADKGRPRREGRDGVLRRRTCGGRRSCPSASCIATSLLVCCKWPAAGPSAEIEVVPGIAWGATYTLVQITTLCSLLNSQPVLRNVVIERSSWAMQSKWACHCHFWYFQHHKSSVYHQHEERSPTQHHYVHCFCLYYLPLTISKQEPEKAERRIPEHLKVGS